MKSRIILAGGSGFLGSVLANHFAARGHEIVILTRKPKPGTGPFREVAWDGATIGTWTEELDGARALINLAGISVNCRYHARNLKLMLDSRLNSTRLLGAAIAHCANPPPVWLNSSTATIYQHTFGPAWDESGEIGGCAEAKDVFSVEIARAWEREFNEAKTPRTRKIALRSAMVLGHAQNSVLPNMLRLVRIGLGGSMAGGHQFVSWIHHQDFSQAIEWLVEHEEISGVVNLAAPNPLPNDDFMRTLREICGVPFGLPAPLWLLEIGAFFMRTETELIIKSRRVVSDRLPRAGFSFRFPELRGAVAELTAKHTNANGTPTSDLARCG